MPSKCYIFQVVSINIFLKRHSNAQMKCIAYIYRGFVHFCSKRGKTKILRKLTIMYEILDFLVGEKKKEPYAFTF